MTLTIENMATMFYDTHHKVVELKKIAKERGLQTTGRKNELVTRLVQDDLEKKSWRITRTRTPTYDYFFGRWGKRSVYIYRPVDGSCKYTPKGRYALLQVEPFHNNYGWYHSDDRGDSLCTKVISHDKLVDDVLTWQSSQVRKIAIWAEQ